MIPRLSGIPALLAAGGGREQAGLTFVPREAGGDGVRSIAGIM